MHIHIMIFTNILIIFRPESTFKRASLGHSSNLNIPEALPDDTSQAENEESTMYTLKQLKRTLYSIYFYEQTIILFWRYKILLINARLNLFADMSKLERIALFRKLMTHVVNCYNYTWLFLEIHMQKVIFISIVLLCIDDVSKLFLFVSCTFYIEQ